MESIFCIAFLVTIAPLLKSGCFINVVMSVYESLRSEIVRHEIVAQSNTAVSHFK